MTILFGAAYYHEYQPYERLEEDLSLMEQASVSVVRVGESTWSKWEPEDGRFEFEWVERVVERVYRAGIRVIVGTPTYAIPPWLWRKYPEIMSQRPDGSVLAYGGRQNVDITHAAFRFHAERVIRACVSRFAGHPAVIGYQIDNEAGMELSCNNGTFRGFLTFLRSRYCSVQELNRRWGLAYWSHEVNSWEELWPPEGNTVPGYDLEWRRYQAKVTTDFLAWQAGIVREIASADQFVTHCLAGGHGRPGADRFEVGAVLDVAAENVYYATQDALVLPDAAEGLSAVGAPDFCEEAGVWALFMKADLAFASKGAGFLVTETNALTIGISHDNFPAYDGQWRLAAFALIARGARSIGYWHLHSCHTGHESYWGGMVSHDLERNRCFNELAQIGLELRTYGEVIAGCVPEADVGMIYSYDSAYGLSFQPPLRIPDTQDPDRRSYEEIFSTWYRAFFDVGSQVRIVPPSADFERFPVLVVPALYVASDELLERLVGYVRDGGHLVLTMRCGYADEDASIRPVRAPAILRDAVGASYQEFSNLTMPLALVADETLSEPLPAGAAAQGWADGLVVEAAEVLVRYDHPHFGKFAAATAHPFGSGTLTYVGTSPNRVLGAWLARTVLSRAGLASQWRDVPASVQLNSARSPDGSRLWFVGNWSWDLAKVRAPFSVADITNCRAISDGEDFELAPWSCRLLREVGAP